MRGFVPSIGAVPSFAHPKLSRIPHLKLHILTRRTAAAPKSRIGSSKPEQRRCVHSITIPQSSALGFFRATEQVDDSRTAHPPSTDAESHTTPAVFGLNDSFDQILDERHPQRLLYAIAETAQGQNFIAQASPEQFTSALCAIDPVRLVDVFKQTCQHHGVTQEFRLHQLSSRIVEILKLRREAGHQMTKEDCTHILYCASVVGDGELARRVWQEDAVKYNLQDDLPLQAYNHYMEAICWSNTFLTQEKMRLRVIPAYQALRAHDDRPPDFSGHKTGPGGLREEVLTAFRDLVSRGLEGDGEIFMNLMVGMGREADLAGVKSILRSVYNIDIDLLLQVDEEEVETPTFYEDDHPLRPTHGFLKTLAHVFSSNNELPLAYKLVDFVSRHYLLPMTSETWAQLLEWAYVHCIPRARTDQRKDHLLGNISYDFFDMLWTNMISPPHNIKPDIFMYTLRAQLQARYHRTSESIRSMRRAISLFEASFGATNYQQQRLLELSEQILSSSIEASLQVLPAEWFNRRQDSVVTSLIKARDFLHLQTTIRILFYKRCVGDPGMTRRAWYRHAIPQLIEQFGPYLPKEFSIWTPSGQVEIHGLRYHRLEAALKRRAQYKQTPKLSLVKHLDRDDIVTVEDLNRAIKNFWAEQAEDNRYDMLRQRSVSQLSLSDQAVDE